MMTEKNEEQVDTEQSELVEEEVSEIDQLREELAEANEAKLRALADFKNFQRRSVENESRAVSNGIARVVRAILPAIEQINLAIEHAQDDAAAQGFSIARDELIKGLTECGVSLISPEVGDPFDAQQHEAMLRQEAEGLETDHIVMVLQRGYRLGEIVICPAKVSVSN